MDKKILRRVREVSAMYAPPGERQDAEQIGVLAAVRAESRFRAEGGASMKTFLVTAARNAVRRHYATHVGPWKLSHYRGPDKSEAIQLMKAGVPIADAAERTGLSPAAVRNLVSISAPAGSDSALARIADTSELDPEKRLLAKEFVAEHGAEIESLPPRSPRRAELMRELAMLLAE